MSNDKHAEFSPSQLPRIIKCPGSYQLSKGVEDNTSKYAEEGTMLHKVTETILRRGEYKVTQTEIKQYQLDQEQTDAVQTCLDWAFTQVNRFSGDSVQTFVEVKGSLENFVGDVISEGILDKMFPHSSGSAIRVLLSEVRGTLDYGVSFTASGSILCNDWKFGKGVRVSSETDQLKAYSLVLALSLGYSTPGSNPCKIEACIGQPRLSDDLDTTKYTDSELYTWVSETLIPALIDATSENPTFSPSVEACRWCKGKAGCKARHGQKQQDALDVFAHIAEDNPMEAVGLKELTIISQTIGGLVKYKKDIDEHLYAQAMKGEKVPGKKLVKKIARRSWKKANAEVAAFLTDHNFVSLKDMYVAPKLLSVAQMEKKVGKLVSRSPDFKGLVMKKSSGLSLVNESDKREEAEINSPEEAFSEFCS